ncbi:hypothetical protein K2V74_00470 [Mammaliicoccus sciuri]|uniref:hypothetical protein n=1 Tax=Mammaliicoccus sciuri TaxID=1296 RepID=UPI001E30E7FD|nr:hypothetical protein [Mammaliicoccus sciuri]MCD8872791.1 hypothetical protein [Mammaliicoccus sciuri]
MLKKILLSTLLCTTVTTPLIGKVYAEDVKDEKPVKYVFKSGGKASAIEVNYDGSMTIPEPGGDLWDVDVKPVDFYITKNGVQTNEVNPKYKHIWDQWAYYDFYASKGRTADLFVGEHPRPLDGVTFVPKSHNKTDNQNNVNDKKDDQKVNDQKEPNKNTTDNQANQDQPKQDTTAKVEQPSKVNNKSDDQNNVADKKVADNEKPVKYIFKSGRKESPVYINSDGSMTIPEETELEVLAPKPDDYYIYKDGVETKEVNPKYKHIKDQWAYYKFYASKGKVADLLVGEHPRPLDGVTFVPKSGKTSDDNKSDDQKVVPKTDQPKGQSEPNKNTTDNQSKSDQPKQDVPAKVEQPAKDNAKVDKKDTDNKPVANNKSDVQNKVAVNNQKSDPQSSDVSKKVDVKKEDSNKDVKAKVTDSKSKSDKQQKELPKTGESENPWLHAGLLSLVGLSLMGIYTINRRSKA